MSGEDGELRTADGERLDWSSPSEAYSNTECDAYLAKVLAQLEVSRSTAVVAARFKRALTGNSPIGGKLLRLATGRVSDNEMHHVATGRDWIRQAALAANPYLPDEIAFELMNNLNAFVRLQLAQNHLAPELALRRLNRDPDTDVQQAAERTLLTIDPDATAPAEEPKPQRKRRRGRR
ncbi:MAG: hypothetical protein AAGA17_06490 [Actinomycetota bacterium]